MSYQQLREELALTHCAFSVTRIQAEASSKCRSFACTNQVFSYVAKQGEAVLLTEGDISCRGAATGLGLRDGLPDIPGTFGRFMSQGGGEGCPSGERVKCSPALGEAMLLDQPQDVMAGCNAIRIAPYCPEERGDLVCLLADPDQLSALLHLFCFRRSGCDEVMVPVVSGCAQIFRIPFGELEKEQPKAVIGNVDFFARPHLAENLLAFTVPDHSFREMCEDVPNSFLYAPAWNGVKKRVKAGFGSPISP